MGTITTFEKTASGQVKTGPGRFYYAQVITDGSHDATCIGYDISSASDAAAGNKLFELKVIGANNYGGIEKSVPTRFGRGLYIALTGSGASYIVEWAK